MESRRPHYFIPVKIIPSIWKSVPEVTAHNPSFRLEGYFLQTLWETKLGCRVKILYLEPYSA